MTDSGIRGGGERDGLPRRPSDTKDGLAEAKACLCQQHDGPAHPHERALLHPRPAREAADHRRGTAPALRGQAPGARDHRAGCE